MNKIILLILASTYAFCLDARPSGFAHEANGDSLPNVLPANRADLLDSRLRKEAKLAYATQQLPSNLEDWKILRETIRQEIIAHSGIKVDHSLPLDLKETGSIQMDGYTIKNIYFQTAPGVYATANLYIPDGKGPFPAVVNMHGHWREGKLAESVQSVGHSLAKNGYVCLTIDAFGSGERATTHGDYEYHGANLGASLMNIGESLLGVQVVDNMRAVDLLLSLPFVDKENIGATGASGGGNQTMWFAALDERIKAAMPIVSVGTFESAVMGSNCVCELMPGGLTFTESAGVLALYAPRALKMCNHHKDSNPTFYPAEMLRSYENAKPIFQLHGVADNIQYELFDLEHGYAPEDRRAMLGFFDLYLKEKGSGEARDEVPFSTLAMEKLMVFKLGERDPKVMGIADYARSRGQKHKETFRAGGAVERAQKRDELRKLLMIENSSGSSIQNVHAYSAVQGWDRMALSTSSGKLIPLLHWSPTVKPKTYVVVSHMEGKNGISTSMLEEFKTKNWGIILVELSGTGEASSPADLLRGDLSQFHTLSRAHLWLGKTMMGEWVEEIRLVSSYVRDKFNPEQIIFDGHKEAGLAALFLAAVEQGKLDALILRNVPLSYVFDRRETIEFFSMGIHVPGVLPWGDISLAAALADIDLTIAQPLSMSGRTISGEELAAYQGEYNSVIERSQSRTKLSFTP